jgi:hypothetical protein
MSSIHADRDDLKRLQRSVTTAQEEIDQAVKKLTKALQSADWDDQARRTFESKLNEAVRGVQQTKQRLGELNPILTRKIAELDAYLRS